MVIARSQKLLPDVSNATVGLKRATALNTVGNPFTSILAISEAIKKAKGEYNAL